ncbi:hypothetical protein AB1Y20_001651 [Prymnesium parvum]|uniref:Glycosyltransferase family 92 protein n=1 Tax=Prymnesium parvum TaxID=97485 RepID=A0AB34KBH3_PRYPA
MGVPPLKFSESETACPSARMRQWAALLLLPAVLAQCPSSCKVKCGPPMCGPNCCKYWLSRSMNIKPVTVPPAPTLAEANATRKLWAERCGRDERSAEDSPSPGTCAHLWASRPAKHPGAPPVVLMAMFKGVSAKSIIHFLEYHFLLGVQHAHIFDNNCGPRVLAAAQTLSPYVQAGLVTHNTQFTCMDMKTFMFEHGFRGGSAMARQLSGMRGVPLGSLVVSVDDDEFIVMRNTSQDLSDLALFLQHRKVCAVQLLWKVYGDSGHKCQPDGALMREFVQRAPQQRELSTIQTLRISNEAKDLMLNPPFIGKPVYLYLSPAAPTCATHFCENCPAGYVNCAQEEGPSKHCRSMGLRARRSWINHYAFQSEEHWELKKLRGRTNKLPARRGNVPKTYNSITDSEGIEVLDRRIKDVQQPELRRCLLNLFPPTEPFGKFAPPGAFANRTSFANAAYGVTGNNRDHGGKRHKLLQGTRNRRTPEGGTPPTGAQPGYVAVASQPADAPTGPLASTFTLPWRYEVLPGQNQATPSLHVLLSRFSAAHLKEDIKLMVALFCSITLPSVAAQTYKEFVWLVYVEDSMAPALKATLSLALAPFKKFFLLPSPSDADPRKLPCREQLERAGLWTIPRGKVIPTFISTGVQVGDALFKDALAMVQLEVSRKPVEHALYCWKRAIRLELNHRARAPARRSIGILALNDEVSARKSVNCVRTGVTLISRVVPSLSVYSGRWRQETARAIGADVGWGRPLITRVAKQVLRRQPSEIRAEMEARNLYLKYNVSVKLVARDLDHSA